jgi:hypothetical protein
VHVTPAHIGSWTELTRLLLVVSVAAAILAIAGAALAARGFSDPAGDVNAAPDITALEVSEATAGLLTITLTVGNYESLPANSWVNLWFDVDSNAETGDAGDEALLRYLSDGGTELFVWNGSRLVEASSAGIGASFSTGVLTVSVPRVSINAASVFDLLAVSSRGQPVGDDQLIASDFAPNAGRLAYTGPAAVALPDPAGDHDAAPDITAVRVSDAKSGWITFAITTPNYAALPEESAIVVSIDADANPRTGESGAELQLSLAAGQIALERWDGRQWVPDELPTRARARNSGNLVAIDLHVSEMRNSSRFRFSILSADVNTAIQGVVAVDVAPDDFSYWAYALANRPALVLVASRPVAQPRRPKAGKSVTVSLAVTRSDTGRPIASGTVSCRVRTSGTKVPAAGRVARGSAHCAFVVPSTAKGKVLRGTISVRTGGKNVARDFAFVAR